MTKEKIRITFDVPFISGKRRPRFRRTPVGVQTYTDRRTLNDEADISLAYKSASIDSYGCVLKTEGPVAITIETYQQLPRSKPKCITEEKDLFKPDIDNIAKLVMDALNDVAYKDDKQVTHLAIKKNPRVRDQQAHMIVQIMFIGDKDGS